MKELTEKVIGDLLAWMPVVIGGALLLVAGLLAAWLVRVVLSRTVKRIGIDRLSERSGVARALRAWGFSRPISHTVGRFGYWLTLIVFMLAAAESMGLSVVSGSFRTVVDYLPHVLGAALIVIVGGLFAGIVGDAVGALSADADGQARSFAGQLVKYTLYSFVIILAVQQLGVDTLLLSSVVILVLAAVLLALALAFGFGSRELARNILAGFHARETFVTGSRLKVRGYSGKLLRIGTYKFVLEHDGQRLSLPNHYLTEDDVALESDGAGQR